MRKNNYLPSASDILLIGGTLGIATGVYSLWGWEWSAIFIGTVLVAAGVAVQLGNE